MLVELGCINIKVIKTSRVTLFSKPPKSNFCKYTTIFIIFKIMSPNITKTEKIIQTLKLLIYIYIYIYIYICIYIYMYNNSDFIFSGIP